MSLWCSLSKENFSKKYAVIKIRSKFLATDEGYSTQHMWVPPLGSSWSAGYGWIIFLIQCSVSGKRLAVIKIWKDGKMKTVQNELKCGRISIKGNFNLQRLPWILINHRDIFRHIPDHRDIFRHIPDHRDISRCIPDHRIILCKIYSGCFLWPKVLKWYILYYMYHSNTFLHREILWYISHKS